MSFVYPILFIVFYFLFKTILTPFFFTRFMVSLSLGGRISEIIGRKDFSRKRTRQQINGGGKSCQSMASIWHARVLMPVF